MNILHRLLCFHYLAKMQNAISPIRLSVLVTSDSIHSRISTSKTFLKRCRHTSSCQTDQSPCRRSNQSQQSGAGQFKLREATNLRFTGVKVKPDNSAL